MLRYASIEELRLDNIWLTIGSFDGVHLGHQALLKRLVGEARRGGAIPAVLTFYPHPAVILRGHSGPYYLSTPQDRSQMIHDLGVEEVILHPFNREVASRTAREFMLMLREHLGLRRLYVGPDFALGRNREGDLPNLQRLGAEFGYSIEVIEPVFNGDGKPISSSRIRQALSEGDPRLASELLGREFAIRGEVVPGDGRGRTIGIPTANLDFPVDLLTPKNGVYACWAQLAEDIYPAVTNVGTRPTFAHNSTMLPRVETHLLDYDANLYGRSIHLRFVERLRDERRFPGVEALVDQIHADIRSAKMLLGV